MPPTHAQIRRAIAALAGVLFASLLPGSAVAVQTQGEARVSLGSGYDSNTGHDVDGQAQGDGVVLGVLQLQAALFSESSVFALEGRYQLGAKKFFVVDVHDLLAQQASLQGTARAGPWTLGLLGAVKDHRSRLGDRDYSDFSGSLLGEARPRRWPLRFDVGAELFQYHPDARYTFAAANADLSATAPIAAHHRLTLSLDAAFRSYAEASVDASGSPRRDGAFGGGLSYRYKGRFVGELGYDFLADLSNQYGWSYQRHRLTGNVAVFLPLRIVLAASGTLQFTRFPDRLALAPEYYLDADDENTNSLALALSRALPHGFQIELKGVGYQSSFATNGFAYHRATVQLSLGWKG